MKKQDFNMLNYCRGKISEDHNSSIIAIHTILGYIQKLQKENLSTDFLDKTHKKYTDLDLKPFQSIKVYRKELLSMIDTIEEIVLRNTK